MSMPQICYKYCAPSLSYGTKRLTMPDSAELEITVQLLVQIDKLVQLIESPVFTCMYLL
jgi:Vacuolar protein 14 C-terminal Fig4p binding